MAKALAVPVVVELLRVLTVVRRAHLNNDIDESVFCVRRGQYHCPLSLPRFSLVAILGGVDLEIKVN